MTGKGKGCGGTEGKRMRDLTGLSSNSRMKQYWEEMSLNSSSYKNTIFYQICEFTHYNKRQTDGVRMMSNRGVAEGVLMG